MSDLQAALTRGSVVAALAVGILLGAFCFGSLWWSVSRGMRSSHPALWLVLTSSGRLTLVFGGFYLVARDSLVDALACALGLFMARGVVLRYLGSGRCGL